MLEQDVGLDAQQAQQAYNVFSANTEQKAITKIVVDNDSYVFYCGNNKKYHVYFVDGVVSKIINWKKKNIYTNVETLEQPAPNTSDAVDYIIRKAREDAKTADEGMLEDARAFLIKQNPEYYTDNETMEKSLYYGALVKYAYDIEDPALSTVGDDVLLAVRYVYRREKAADSEETKKALTRLSEDIAAMFQASSKP